MPNLHLYTVVAADAIDQASPDLEKIKSAARDLCAKHSDVGGADFIVVEITVIGRFEKTSPVWIEGEGF